MEKAIFYVDDDPDDLEIFADVANALGHAATLFDDGTDLIEAIKNAPVNPSLIFIDLNMPKISGFEVLEELRKIKSTAPAIVLTTAKDNATIEKCRKMGAKMFIQKPNSIKELRAIMNEVFQIKWDNLAARSGEFVFRRLQ